MDNISITFREDSDYGLYQELYRWLGRVHHAQKEQEFNTIVEEFERKKALANILKEIQGESK